LGGVFRVHAEELRDEMQGLCLAPAQGVAQEIEAITGYRICTPTTANESPPAVPVVVAATVAATTETRAVGASGELWGDTGGQPYLRPAASSGSGHGGEGCALCHVRRAQESALGALP
jgi:hypothetical protein